MNKLITDVCKKINFSFNNDICKKSDGVSMGFSFGTMIANTFMTELEKCILDIMMIMLGFTYGM